jgi:hydroxymethylbilane synthase
LKQAIKIGTRDSQLAIWQAELVQSLFEKNGIVSELVHINSKGDVDTFKTQY